jgi:hypothetical protein
MNEETIKQSSDEKLLISLSDLFLSERKITRLILLHLLEIDVRQLYAKRGFESLFQMLIEHYKLSETSANQRLKAIKLLKDVSTAQASLVSGELNLTTLAMAQCQISQEEKITGVKISAERKSEIVEKIKNKTQKQTEVELFKLLPETATQPKTYEKRISENETRLGLNIPDRVLNKLKRLREIWSHVDSNMDYVQIIERCADETLKRVDPSLKTKAVKQSATGAVAQEVTSKEISAEYKPDFVSNEVSKSENAKNVFASSKPGTRAKYFPVAVSKKLHGDADSCCVFVDPVTKRRCRSKFLLQIDHIVPIWAGGTNAPENLQLLCAVHNRLKYKLETNKLSDRTSVYLARTGSH